MREESNFIIGCLIGLIVGAIAMAFVLSMAMYEPKFSIQEACETDTRVCQPVWVYAGHDSK